MEGLKFQMRQNADTSVEIHLTMDTESAVMVLRLARHIAADTPRIRDTLDAALAELNATN